MYCLYYPVSPRKPVAGEILAAGVAQSLTACTFSGLVATSSPPTICPKYLTKMASFLSWLTIIFS